MYVSLYKILIFVEFLSLSLVLNTANNHTWAVSYSSRAGVQVTGYQATVLAGDYSTHLHEPNSE